MLGGMELKLTFFSKLSASSSRAREAGRAADEALEDAKEALLRAKLSIPASSSLLHDAARERVLFFEQKRAALRARLDESTASWALPADEQTRELLQLRNVQLAQLQQQEGDAEFVLTLAQERNEDLRKIEADVAALSVGDLGCF
jgi:hypothetical protein